MDLNELLKSTEKALDAASPKATQNGTSLGTALESLIEDTIKKHVSHDLVLNAVRETVANLAPKKVKFYINGAKKGTVNHAHKQLVHVVKLLARGLVPCLYGDSGTGKTTLARQVAEALELDFFVLALTESTPTSVFAGTKGVDGKYSKSAVFDWATNGGVLLIDEWDRADPNTISWWNMPLDNRIAAFPLNTEQPKVELNHKALVILASNTMGEGNTRDFVAANRQDKSLRERVIFVPVDYDEDLEKILVGEQICDFMHHLRRRVRHEKIGRSISTRHLVQIQKLMHTNGDKGFTLKEAVEMIMLPWSETEKESIKDCLAMLGEEDNNVIPS